MYIIYIHSLPLSLSLCVSLCLCLCLCLSLLLFLWEGMVGSKTVKSVSMKQIFEEKGKLKRFQTWVCNCLLTKCLTTRHIWGGGGGGVFDTFHLDLNFTGETLPVTNMICFWLELKKKGWKSLNDGVRCCFCFLFWSQNDVILCVYF